MKVLVLGADGFIGRHLIFHFRQQGWDVLACARNITALHRMGFQCLKADLTNPETHDPDFWAVHARDATHVVIAAGLLSASDKAMQAVHVDAPRAIYTALPPSVPKLLISAVGIVGSETGFARHRRASEALICDHGGEALRVGLVLGETSYGGSSLARALAALPGLTPLIGGGGQLVNPIHAGDLAVVVEEQLRAPTPGQVAEIGGPETLTQAQMLAEYRRWLGLGRALAAPVPKWLARAAGWIGDALRMGPISSTAVAQLNHGIVAQPSFTPDHPVRGFRAFLWDRPAGTQDLWHARLYLIRPLIRLVLALMWLVSGVLGLILSPETFLPFVTMEGISDTLLVVLARIGGVFDLLIALALLRGWRPRHMALVQIAMVGGYTAGLSVLAPALWALPLGGVLKNLPILTLLLVHLILERER